MNMGRPRIDDSNAISITTSKKQPHSKPKISKLNSVGTKTKNLVVSFLLVGRFCSIQMKRNLKIVWCWWTRGGGVGFWVASIFGWRRRDFA
jgi:hypothetical protein